MTWLLPSFLRKVKQIAWLLSLIKPIIELHLLFLPYRLNSNYMATVNGQVNRLTHALRTVFNDNTITIIHPVNNLLIDYIYHVNEAQPPTYIYHVSESGPPLYLYPSSIIRPNFSFIVIIPNGLIARAAEIYAFVDRYRQVGYGFAIWSPNYPSGTQILP